ncbi:MAG: tyrosine-type recombinase/integrase [Candidatus Binataceae bacterium]
MRDNNKSLETAEDLLRFLDEAHLTATRRRNMKSAINRICEMAGCIPWSLHLKPPIIREVLRKILPALHGVSSKTWANMRSLFAAALEMAGVIDRLGRGVALRHPVWGPLMRAIASDQRLTGGLAAFANWCAIQGISPEEVDDAALQRFLIWLENRTLYPKPRDLVRRVPNVWNEASAKIEFWPKTKLTILSFRAPRKRLQWNDLSESFRLDAEAYLTMRGAPDLFDDRPNAPRRPLAASTLRQQREHLRLAASVLVESGVTVEDIKSLADLVQPEPLKRILRHYHERANGQPNAFAICLAQTLTQVTQYHVGATADELAYLKRIASKLPPVPHELTPKNKVLLRQFESERLRAKLLFLPDQLMADVAKDLEKGRLNFVKAQVAIAIDFQLAIPLRPQNLSSLNWGHHFSEPDGPKGRLLLHIPASETKSRRDDFIAEIPEHVARRLRWYRRYILTRLNADVNGDLFVTKAGSRKDQRTITVQIIKAIARHLGVHMTPQQFRHLAGASYLDQHPEDTETARLMLGHAWSKTTRIYVGSSSRRASRAYGEFLFKQRDALKLKRKRQLNRKRKKGAGEAPCAS